MSSDSTRYLERSVIVKDVRGKGVRLRIAKMLGASWVFLDVATSESKGSISVRPEEFLDGDLLIARIKNRTGIEIYEDKPDFWDRTRTALLHLWTKNDESIPLESVTRS